MIGESARTRANRHNAARSTGPTSDAGKARVAQNARQHGLSLPILADADFGPRVTPLARAIAGQAADLHRLEAATKIAEAELDLLRIRRLRHALLEAPAVSADPSVRDLTHVLRLADKGLPRDERARRTVALLLARTEGGPAVLWQGLGGKTTMLVRLERYERRALSRRKTAVQALDALASADAAGS